MKNFKKLATLIVAGLAISFALAQGPDTAVQNQNTIQTETQEEAAEVENDDEMAPQAIKAQERVKEKKKIRIWNQEVETNLEIQEATTLQAKLSNGRNAEIKVLPETASETARARLQSNFCGQEEGCQIQLKEVGQQEQTRAAYEIQTTKRVKLFWVFNAQMRIRSQIDAENGEVIKEKKPRRSFLARFMDTATL